MLCNVEMLDSWNSGGRFGVIFAGFNNFKILSMYFVKFRGFENNITAFGDDGVLKTTVLFLF